MSLTKLICRFLAPFCLLVAPPSCPCNCGCAVLRHGHPAQGIPELRHRCRRARPSARSRRPTQARGELYAYVSVAEVQRDRAYYPNIPADWKLARNQDWDSEVIDQTPAAWPDFFAEQVVGPLGTWLPGFLFDTLESYRPARQFDEKAQQQGLIRVIETLHRRYPGIQLILNRGFEIVPAVRDKIRMVAAESTVSWLECRPASLRGGSRRRP